MRTSNGIFQFDCGRNTVLRLAEAGQELADIDGIFLTHHHFDHIIGFADLFTTRWQTQLNRADAAPLTIVAPRGPIREVLEKTYDSLRPDIAQRIRVLGIEQPSYDLREFAACEKAKTVFERGDMRVMAVRVPHGHVEPSVAYRIDCRGSRLVISGDCNKSEAVVELARGADVLIHEAVCRPLVEGTYLEKVLNSHTECREVGEVARCSGVPRLVVTHLIPSPTKQGDVDQFIQRIREGGFDGDLVIASDLHQIEL